MLALASDGFKNGLTRARCFGSKKLEKECLVSVVADLRRASLPTVRFITETLLLLEVPVLVPAGAVAADLLPVLTRERRGAVWMDS